jgi:hypothetical protein
MRKNGRVMKTINNSSKRKYGKLDDKVSTLIIESETESRNGIFSFESKISFRDIITPFRDLIFYSLYFMSYCLSV